MLKLVVRSMLFLVEENGFIPRNEKHFLEDFFQKRKCV